MFKTISLYLFIVFVSLYFGNIQTEELSSSQQIPEQEIPKYKISNIHFVNEFNVYFNSIYIGNSKHWFDCYQVKCEIKSLLRTKGVAALFSDAVVTENSVLEIDKDNRLVWKKYLYKEIKKQKKIKERLFIKQGNFITDQKSKKQVKLENNTFDILSMAYALYWDKKHFGAIQSEYSLIENSFYFRKINYEFIGESYTSINKKKLKTLYFKYQHPKADISIWLVPQWNYLPSKIHVYNKNKNSNTVFEVLKIPEFNLK